VRGYKHRLKQLWLVRQCVQRRRKLQGWNVYVSAGTVILLRRLRSPHNDMELRGLRDNLSSWGGVLRWEVCGAQHRRELWRMWHRLQRWQVLRHG
jgi:hypothetical protein